MLVKTVNLEKSGRDFFQLGGLEKAAEARSGPIWQAQL